MAPVPASTYESLIQAAPDAVILVRYSGQIEMASPAVEQMFGYSPEALVGKAVELLLPGELRERHVQHRAGYAHDPMARAMGAELELHGRRRDGSTFPVDVTLAPVVVDGSKQVCAFVRNASGRRRSEDLQRYLNEISRHLLAGGPAQGTLALVARLARALGSAAAAWAVVPESGTKLCVVAADGEGTEALVGSTLSARSSLSARAMALGEPLHIADMAEDRSVLPEAGHLDIGPGLYLPMLYEEGSIGTLVVARKRGASQFEPDATRVLEAFASAASVVLSLARAREELQRLGIVAEHERIARDLHDTVIQRLFALGMALQGVQHLVEGTIAERMSSAVDSIDEVIREIRETIFELTRPDTGGPDIRQQVREVVAEAAVQLGFEPRVAFRGPVEAAVTVELVPEILAVAREALSNTARHAEARNVDLVLEVGEGDLTLAISDDGVGISDGPSAGHGLVNMEERAARLGGELRISPRRPQGTLITWRVPQQQGL